MVNGPRLVSPPSLASSPALDAPGGPSLTLSRAPPSPITSPNAAALLDPVTLGLIAAVGGHGLFGPAACASRSSLLAALETARSITSPKAFCRRCRNHRPIHTGSHCRTCGARLRSILEWELWSPQFQLRFCLAAFDIYDQWFHPAPLTLSHSSHSDPNTSGLFAILGAHHLPSPAALASRLTFQSALESASIVLSSVAVCRRCRCSLPIGAGTHCHGCGVCLHSTPTGELRSSLVRFRFLLEALEIIEQPVTPSPSFPSDSDSSYSG